MENWKEISGFVGLYEVSDLGNIRSLKLNRIRPMAICKKKSGYVSVTLRDRAQRACAYLVHRLVAQAFIRNIDPLRFEVNHKNGNKSDNNVNNLEWVTRKENCEHAVKNGLKPGKYKRLGIVNAYKMRDLWHKKGCSKRRLADMFGVSVLTVINVIRARAYC